MKRVKILGIVSLVLGLILILNSASSITGLVIVENLNKTVGSILGLALIIGGIIAMQAGEEEEGERRRGRRLVRAVDAAHSEIWREGEKLTGGYRTIATDEGDFVAKIHKGGPGPRYMDLFKRKGKNLEPRGRARTRADGSYEIDLYTKAQMKKKRKERLP